MARAHFLSQFEFASVEVHRDYVGADRRRDLDSRKTDSAAAVHRDPFARPHLRAVDDPVVRGHEAASERGALEKAHRVRHMDQVEIGERDADVGSVAAMVSDAGDERGVADVGVAGAAQLAGAVALAERDEYSVALLEVFYLFADFLVHPDQLMP